MGLQVIAPPVEEPVPLEDIKADLRVSHTDDDAQLTRLTAEAREWVEQRVQRELALKTWQFTIDYFPAHEIILPHRPIDSVVSVKYDNIEGFEETMLPTAYFLDNASEPGWLFPVTTWPATYNAVNTVRIAYTAGYADPALMPAALKSAVTLMVQELYDGPDGGRQTRINDLLMNSYLLVA